MKKIKMYEFVKRFNELEELEGFEFVISITRNFNKFKDEVELLEKAKAPTKEYTKYSNAVTEEVKKAAEKDDKGEFIIIKDANGRDTYKLIDSKKDELNKLVEKLSKEHSKAIENQKEIEAKFIDELNSDIDFKIATMTKADLPKDINPKQLELIYDMVIWE
jgi:Fe2+ transport system protein B